MDTVPCCAVPCRAGLHINSRCGLLCGLCAEPLQERKESFFGQRSWMLHWFFIEPLLSYKHVAIDTSTNKYPAHCTRILWHIDAGSTHIYIYIDIHIFCNCLERQQPES